MLRALGAGCFAYPPLGQQVRERVQDAARQVLARFGGQEISLPAAVPEAAWEEAGLLPAGLPVRDGAGRTLRLPPTVEPLLTTLLRPDLRSHRSLPLLLYGFRPSLRGELLTGPGPLSARQSLLLEAFTLQSDASALARGAAELLVACHMLLHSCGLGEGVVPIAYPDGAHSGELVLPAVPGEELFVRCPQCGYVAGLHRAWRFKQAGPPEEPLPPEEVLTPGCHTIAELAAFLGVPESRTAKAVFLVAGDRLVFAVVRGDMDVDEEKLARLVGVERFRPATEDEISAIGASPGFASPIGIRRSASPAGLLQVLVVADDLVVDSPNLVVGANKADTHLRNVTCGRDYTADVVGDIVAVRAGDSCPQCRGALELFATTVLARLWDPGPAYSRTLGATFQDSSGQEHPLHLACAALDVDRLVAACVEVHHDDAGIRWPVPIAPYAVHLLTIGNAPEVLEAASGVEAALQQAGYAVLFDDRDLSTGVKFVEADLLGMPLRVAVSKRTVAQGAAEVKRRDEPREAVQVIPLERVPSWVQDALDAGARDPGSQLGH
jgi:prolyl-tRNA synthetase